MTMPYVSQPEHHQTILYIVLRGKPRSSCLMVALPSYPGTDGQPHPKKHASEHVRFGLVKCMSIPVQ